MAGRTEFTIHDFDILDQAMHRLHRIRDYSAPNGMPYFGVPSENNNARESLADITNQASDYLDNEINKPFQPKLHSSSRNRILYFLKESDEHINHANQEAGVSVQVPHLYEEMQALFDKMGFTTPLNDIAPPNDQAREEIRRFKQHYDPHQDAMIFRDNAPVAGEVVGGELDGTPLRIPFNLNSVEFDEARIRAMLQDVRPELFVDFTHSKDAIVAAVSKMSAKDGEIVARVLDSAQRTVEMKWGDKVTQNQVSEPLGVKWPLQDWGELSNDGMKYIIKLWQDIRDKIAATRVAYDSTDDMIASLNKPAIQKLFIAKTLTSAALQPGPTPPGMKPSSDDYPDH